jgi:hypothetical protein
MGVKNSVEVIIELPIQQSYIILKEIGSNVKKYNLIDSSLQTFTIIWRKGNGWTNPIRVRADLQPINNTRTKVCISAEIAALVDPFNSTTKAIDLFEKSLRERISKVSSVHQGTGPRPGSEFSPTVL